MSGHLAWVIGGSGLLGSAIQAQVATGFTPEPVPWGSDQADTVLARDLDRFLDQASAFSSWSIYWAAGAGVIGTDLSVLQRETTVVAAFVSRLASRAGDGNGAFFFSSSASVYAASTHPPFDESTVPAPGSDYARARLEQERLVAEALDGRLPHVIGRISTLYGAGQDLTKGQGLISTMCLQTVQRQPIRIVVPMDTLRDYLYVDDAARIITTLVEAARASGSTSTRIRIVAHGSAVSIADLSAQVSSVGRRGVGVHRVIVPLGQHARDLRLTTRYAEETAAVRRTPLPVGVAAVHSDLLARMVRGQLT